MSRALLWATWLAAATPGAGAPQAVAAVERAEEDLGPAAALEGDAAAVTLDVPDTSDDLTDDVDRWVLHDVLAHDLAHSLVGRPETALGAHLATHARPAWPQALEQARLLSRLRGLPLLHHPQDAARLLADIPLADHPLVDLYIDYFTGRGRLFFQRWLARASRFRPMMEEILAARGLPRDLVFVAMVESGFSAHAVSSARAVGFWQFISGTGRLFGLRRTPWVDERRDFVRATEAAASYLAELYRNTGDWHLAWASYNAGEGRIRRALARSGTHTFWDLIAARHGLAKETVHYVPKVIAACIIAKNAERYGFAEVPKLEPLVFDEIEIDRAVDIRRLATRSGADLALLRELNPALLFDITPPEARHRLRVPRGDGVRLASTIRSMPPAQRLTFWQHRVQRGDTLSGIARLYRSDTRAIAEMNHMRPEGLLRAGRTLMVPAVPARAPTTKNAALARGPGRRPARLAAPRLRPAPDLRPAQHTVAAGDTLWSIARRYGVSVERLRATNTVAGARRLAIGEVLDIF